MPKEPMIRPNQETLGEYLRKKREALLVPVQEIAQAVGSPKDLVESLEENDFEAFNQRAHAQALVKKYAVYLKIDEADTLKRFDMQWQRYSEQRGFPKLSSFEEPQPGPAKFTVSTPRIKLPDLWHPPKLTTFKFSLPKLRLPIFAVILLVGLFLLIDLPLSKQKPQPPPDPRFSQSDSKGSVAAVPLPPPPATEEKPDTASPETRKPKEDTPPLPETKQEERKAESRNGKVVGNSDTKRYHLPGMKYYSKIKSYHRVVFQSEREAIKAGYRRAKE